MYTYHVLNNCAILKSALENQLLFPSWPGENLTALWDANHWDMCHLFWPFLVDETRKSCDSLNQLPFKTWSSPVRSNFTETCNLLWSFNSLRCIVWKMIHSLVLHTLDQPTLHKHFESHSVYIYISSPYIEHHWTIWESMNHHHRHHFQHGQGPTENRPVKGVAKGHVWRVDWADSNSSNGRHPTPGNVGGPPSPMENCLLIKHDQTKLNYPLNQLLVKQYLGFMMIYVAFMPWPYRSLIPSGVILGGPCYAVID